MTVLAMVGSKGGVGKTTLAINLADALASRSATCLIDADPQRSATQWSMVAADAPGFDVISSSGSLEEAIGNASQEYEHVLVDCPPAVGAPETSAALGCAELALLPVQPSPMDIWATVHIAETIRDAQKGNDRLRALLVINQLEQGTILSRFVRMAVSELSMDVAATAIRRRAVYRNSLMEGKTVFGAGHKGAEARAELLNLVNEVLAR